jgi:ribulose-phosphate 3-epimerase
MDKGPVKLAPSILAADFARLGEQVAEAEQAGADRIHIDVMDGHFVSNLSMGAPIVASLRRVTRLPLETHLMISDPDFFLEEFVDAGSDSFLVHWEGNANLHRTVQSIKALGKRAGVAITGARGNPAGYRAGVNYDCQSRFRASAFHPDDTAKDPEGPFDDRES